MVNQNNFIRHHSYAVEIEHILCNIFNCERFGFGGIVNADYIDRNPYSAIACGLSVYYLNVSQEQQKDIDKLLNEYCFYNNKSITEIGEDEIKKIISDFRKLLDKIK
ncbi:hypothetical protein ACQX0N_10195 [Clostridium tepidum]